MAEYLSVKEVAATYNVHEMTVRRHIAAGMLPAIRVGRSIRVRQEDLEHYLETVEAGRRWRPLTEDDPIFKLLGDIDDPASAWVSENKYAALAEAYRPQP